MIILARVGMVSHVENRPDLRRSSVERHSVAVQVCTLEVLGIFHVYQQRPICVFKGEESIHHFSITSRHPSLGDS